MKFTVDSYEEQEDGSVIIEMSVDEEAEKFLIEYAIKKILEEKIKEMGIE